MRYLLRIAYDGGAYAGWQRQVGLPTVAETIEKALSRLLDHPITIVGAGRTDKGVHAIGQYAHWDSDKPLKRPFLSRLNALIPKDIQVLSLFRVSDDFHARHSALRRHYRYFIGKNLPLFWRRYAYGVEELPSVERLEEAAMLWVGERDFRAFCKGAGAYEHTRCHVYSAQWSERTYASGTTLLVFDVEANRFLHGMVRYLVGASLRYAMGRLSYERLVAAIAAGDRRWGMWEAPASGLFLYGVRYPEELLSLLEHYGPASAEPFPAAESTAGPESAPDSGGAATGIARSGAGPTY